MTVTFRASTVSRLLLSCTGDLRMAMCLPTSAAAPSVPQLDLGRTPKKKIVLRDGQVKLAKDRWPVLGQLPPLLTLALCFIAPSLPRHRLHQLLPASRALAPFGLTGTCTLHHGDSGANSPHWLLASKEYDSARINRINSWFMPKDIEELYEL